MIGSITLLRWVAKLGGHQGQWFGFDPTFCAKISVVAMGIRDDPEPRTLVITPIGGCVRGAGLHERARWVNPSARPDGI